MRLICDNRVLIQNQPKTILTAALTATGTTLTVGSNTGFADDDYLILGKIGEEKTEIVKIGAAVTAGTSITIGACVYDHDIDTPVTKIDYNQVDFYYGTTITASDSTSLTSDTPKDIDPTENYTYYEDTTYTTGYGFVRFYNKNSGNYSVYSDAINYSTKTGYTSKMLRSMRNKVRRLIDEKDEMNSEITNDEINEEINIAQKEIAHDRLWTFYEKTKSFSSVANQYEYSLASDVFVPYNALYDSQPLAVIDWTRWSNLRWDTNVTGDPTHISMWGRKAYVYPYPSDSADTTTLDGDITASATEITVDDNSDFPDQGRFIIGSEVISYTGKDSTTGFTGCTRGDEGTTAATHSDEDTVTERDFLYHFQEDPDDLEDETDATDIPDSSCIVYKAAAECALNLEKQVLHDRLTLKYERALSQLKNVDTPKIKGTFSVVKDASEIVHDYGVNRNKNDYPNNIQGVS